MTRKDFLGSMAGAAAVASASQAPGPANAATPAAAPKKANIRRGVSLYSYIGDFHSAMTMEDCFMEMNDMGAYGLEILSEAHIPDYPNPSNAWVDHWYKMLAKYRIEPAFYSCWQCDTGTPEDCLDWLYRDMRLANRLGFKRMRPKVAGTRRQPGQTGMGMGQRPASGRRVGPGFGTPVDEKWEEWVQKALPTAERLDVRFAPEIHSPTLLNSQVVKDLVAFCEKEKNPHFGIQIDTGIFATKRARLGDAAFENEPDPEREKQRLAAGTAPGGGRGGAGAPGGRGSGGGQSAFSDPKELIPILPYVIHFHAKYWEMLEDFTEYSIPFDGVIAALKEGGYDGYFCSEYEGPRTQGLASIQLRRNHILLKRLLGEYA